MIVATAGHIDHGKTSLVRALTGEDTDRLPEEKRRGMSIDLGFAYLARAGREPLAFVDVPGHERFVRNMTAGVQGIDLALLVVAADDGPMPQTREHLEILERLGAPTLLVALTKTDRVPAARVVEATEETRALLAPTRYADAGILPLSSITGEGLAALRARLDDEAGRVAPRAAGARFRMNVDRAFVVDGTGLVVTGTVLAGAIGAGDEVRVLPGARRARVRGLRANHGEASRAVAGQRCALALHGLARGEAGRGDIVVDDADAPRARHLDVIVEPVRGGGEAFTRPREVGVHLGTALLQARLQPLGRERRFARLAFPREVSAWHGDRFLVRDPGTQRLAGAGTVLDPMPPERGAARPQRLALLERLASGSAGEVLDALLDAEPWQVDSEWFARCWHLSADELTRFEAPRALAAFALRKVRHLMRADRWNGLCDALERAVGAWHAAQPDSPGPRPAELNEASPAVVDFLTGAGRLARDGPHLRLPGHRALLSEKDEALWEECAPLIAGSDGRPPRVLELAEQMALPAKALTDFLQRVARVGRVQRVAPNRWFLSEAIERLAALAATLDAESQGRGFSAATYRDRSNLGRNLTIEVLEFLDKSGHTRRAGDLRRMAR